MLGRCPIRNRCRPRLILAGLMAPLAFLLPAEPSAALEAKNDTDFPLLQSARRAFEQQDHERATQLIEEACRKQPDLLQTDIQLTPSEWNRFWQATRATVHERRLSDDDDAGRVAIAERLHQAGLLQAARTMVIQALSIDPRNETAQQYARDWHAFGGGLVQYALHVRFNQPLLQETIQDENIEERLRSDKTFMLLPVQYFSGHERLALGPGSLIVRDEAGRQCSFRGLLLCEWQQRHRNRGAQESRSGLTDLDLKLQPSQDPIWETVYVAPCLEPEETMIDVDAPPAVPHQPFDLECVNTISPNRRSGGSNRRSSSLRNRDQTRQGSGFVIFVAEIPKDAEFVRCELAGSPDLDLPLDLVRQLDRDFSGLEPLDQKAGVTVLGRFATNPVRPIAAAAISKLAAIRRELSEVDNDDFSRGQEADAQGSDPLVQEIESALLEGLNHPDAFVRELTFDALLDERLTLSTGFLSQLTDTSDLPLLMELLELLEERLAESIEKDEGDSRHHRSRRQRDVPAMIADTMSDRPRSRAGFNDFALIHACLSHDEPAIRNRAVQIIIEDGSQQSLMLLTSLPGESRSSLVALYPRIRDPQLKAAVLKLVLLTAGPDVGAELLRESKGLSLKLRGEDDPLLIVMSTGQLGPATTELVNLLVDADFSHLADSPKLEQALLSLPIGQPGNQGLAEIALSLARRHFDGRYVAPTPVGDRRSMRRSRHQGNEANPFEALLTVLATHANIPRSVYQEAAGTLLEAGRIEPLDEGLHASADPNRRVALMRFFVRSGPYARHPDLPQFLARGLNSGNNRTTIAALNGLAVLYKSLPRDALWQFRLSAKMGISTEALLDLSLDKDRKIAEPATSFLAILASMSTDEEKEFALLTEKAARQGMLYRLDVKRITQPGADYGSMFYLTISEQELSPNGSRSSHRNALAMRRQLPMIGPTVQIQLAGNGQYQVVAAGRRIGQYEIDPKRMQQQTRRPNTQISINIGPMLRSVLTSEAARQQELVGRLDILELTTEQSTNIQYTTLGNWEGTWNSRNRGRSASGTYPIQLEAAWIILEPK